MFKKKYAYNYDKELIIYILNSIQHTNQAVVNDVLRSIDFINSAFDDYNNASVISRVNFAFLIPMRVSRHSQEYWEDVIEFIPALKYLNLDEAYKIMISLPPCKIEFYGPHSKDSTGVVIMAPVFGDMVQDYRNKYLLLRRMRKKIQDTVDFANKKFQVNYIGLGGMLPKITSYGKTIKKPNNVALTTGHAGTVSLINLLFKDVLSKLTKTDLTIGVLGGGSIGKATLELLTCEHPNFNYLIYDKREKINTHNLKYFKSRDLNIKVANGNHNLLEKSDVVISAITKKIDLKNIDLSNKIIIDDSQPGSFDKNQIEALGGKLLWVVGNDSGENSYVSRRNHFTYGPYGLCSYKNVWGCEAEVAILAYYNKHNANVTSEVTLEDINIINDLFVKYGITIAEYQAFGKKTNI